MNGRQLPITGTSEETRDWTFVGDIVQGLLACAYYDEAVGEAVDLATGTEDRVLNLATHVNELTQNHAGMVYKERRNWERKTRLLANIAKAKRFLKYAPKTEFEDGLRRVHEWFKKNWAGIKGFAEF